MLRRILFAGAAIAFLVAALTGCNNPVSGEDGEDPTVPAGATLITSDGFGPDTVRPVWGDKYMINDRDFYTRMRIADDAAHTGKHSLTTDSNRTALVHEIRATDRVEKGIVGVQFFIMAKSAGQINFTVEMGQYGGSSGGLFKSFGIGFDVRDSIKCTSYDNYGGRTDKIVGAITPDHWYDCKVEVDFTAQTATYHIDGAKVWEGALPTLEMYGIDRLLVFRGELAEGKDYSAYCSEGSKQYYVDDIVFYKK